MDNNTPTLDQTLNLKTLLEQLPQMAAEAEGMVASEQLGGNVVKENFWRGRLGAFRAVQAIIDAPNEE